MTRATLTAALLALAACGSAPPFATCAEFDTQAEAQAMVESGDVRINDPDDDGVYCESLPEGDAANIWDRSREAITG